MPKTTVNSLRGQFLVVRDVGTEDQVIFTYDRRESAAKDALTNEGEVFLLEKPISQKQLKEWAENGDLIALEEELHAIEENMRDLKEMEQRCREQLAARKKDPRLKSSKKKGGKKK